ncbi:cysteine ABC transporter ATP-binding protein, partial [Staphylococcus warneri]
IVPWLSAKKARTLKRQVALHQSHFLQRFYDYKEGDDELRRFRQRDEFKTDVLQRLKQYDTMQSKERRFLSLYDYMLNII